MLVGFEPIYVHVRVYADSALDHSATENTMVVNWKCSNIYM